MKIISMYFPKEHITTLINEWFEGLSKNSDISSFKVLSTTRFDDGVLILVEAFENDKRTIDEIVDAIKDELKRNLNII